MLFTSIFGVNIVTIKDIPIGKNPYIQDGATKKHNTVKTIPAIRLRSPRTEPILEV